MLVIGKYSVRNVNKKAQSLYLLAMRNFKSDRGGITNSHFKHT